MPTKMGRKSLFGVSATAISALGLLLAPAPAQAEPPSDQYGFPGRMTVREDHGAGDFIDISFNATGSTVSGPATWSASKGDDSTGTTTGGISGDGAVDLTYMPPTEGGAVRFIGAVRESDMKGLGTQGEEKWFALLPFTCLGAAAPQESDMAKVTGDVDMYDAPGGVGKQYPGFLDDEDGTATVKLIACQDDNWCNVVAPRGPVWVWGGDIEH